MADLAMRIPAVAGNDLALLQGGMGVLGVAFLIKAGMWPLGFWLPRTYGVATPPAAAICSATISPTFFRWTWPGTNCV